MQFTIEHESEQDEAGGRRKVQAQLGAVAFDSQARLMAGAKLGVQARFQGFLAAKGKRSQRLVLHVTKVEFVEGDGDASAS